MDCDFSRAAPAERRWRLIFALFLLPWAQTSWSAGTGTYAYDDLGRLKSVIYNSGNGIIYKYDDAGNRVTQYTGSIAVFDISAPNVTEGGSVVFTVTRSGNTAVAASVSYGTRDVTAAAGTDYTAASGTLNFTSGQTSKTFNVATTNDTAYEGSESFRGYLKGPSLEAVVGTSYKEVSVADNDPVPSFGIANATATEGTNLSFTVTRTNATAVPHSIRYATASGTAVDGVDFEGTADRFVFLPTESSKVITVPTTPDTVFSGSRALTVTLTEPTNGAVIGQAIANGTINDDDPAPTFAIDDRPAVSEGAAITFTVTKANATKLTHAVNYSAVSGTATSGSDFPATSGTLTFAPGATSKTVTILTTDDTSSESANETFTLQLSGATNGAQIADASGLGSISDNEGQVPLAPNPLVLDDPNTADSSFGLSWSYAPGNPTRYELYESKNNAAFTLVYSGLLLQQSFTKGNFTFDYKVRACNTVGCGPYSNTVSVTISNCSGAAC